MRMRALDSFYSSETKQVKAGDEFEVSDVRGRQFAAKRLAQPIVKAQPAPLNKAEIAPQNKAGADPLDGGPTGSGKPALSSHPGQAQRTRQSKRRKAARG